ncbi:hypothetical protein H009_19534 [Agrobacterium tumefaciens str. Cherry 2E-2-2]|nr:hypothetical protein H009_19534 [Agrobacterium tumefaciens str. Cherry 2E-2-2]
MDGISSSLNDSGLSPYGHASTGNSMPDFGVRKIGYDLIFAFAPAAGTDAGYRWQVADKKDLTDDTDRHGR